MTTGEQGWDTINIVDAIDVFVDVVDAFAKVLEAGLAGTLNAGSRMNLPGAKRKVTPNSGSGGSRTAQ
mgnify:FL=1|jgi:hypothetical protein